MTEWTKGNKPYSQGLYWITVNEVGKIKMYDEPMRYKDGIWQLGGKNYHADNIIAHTPCNKPSEPYNELHIGFPDSYYIRVTRNGIISYLSKGFQSVKWSKIGYATKEKAVAAMKRYVNSEIEMGYKEIIECAVVNGNGEEV